MYKIIGIVTKSDLLQEINDDGATIIIVTHETDISQMTKRVVRLRDGVIEEGHREQ